MITISIYLYIDTKKSAILVLIHLHWFLRIHMQLWSKSTFVLIFREKHRSMLTPVTRLQHMHIMYQDGVFFQTDLLFVCWQAAESSSVNRSWSNWFSFPSYCCFTFYEYICFTQLSYFDEKREKKKSMGQVAIFHYIYFVKKFPEQHTYDFRNVSLAQFQDANHTKRSWKTFLSENCSCFVLLWWNNSQVMLS